MSTTISYAAALDGVIEDAEMLAYITGLVEDHKKWGSFELKRFPSFLVATLVDEIKRLKEQQLGFYGQSPPAN
jgi:hypothetical protein